MQVLINSLGGGKQSFLSQIFFFSPSGYFLPNGIFFAAAAFMEKELTHVAYLRYIICTECDCVSAYSITESKSEISSR